MITYCITFPDNSIYIGATSETLGRRITKHRYEWRKRKKMTRPVYQKMAQFNGEFKVKELSTYSNEDEMYDGEKGYLALFNGEKLLNNSTGGKGCGGAKHSKKALEKCEARYEKMRVWFKVYCAETKKLLYFGNNYTECANKLGTTAAVIHRGLERSQKKVKFKKVRDARRKYIYLKLKQGVTQCP